MHHLSVFIQRKGNVELPDNGNLTAFGQILFAVLSLLAPDTDLIESGLMNRQGAVRHALLGIDGDCEIAGFTSGSVRKHLRIPGQVADNRNKLHKLLLPIRSVPDLSVFIQQDSASAVRDAVVGILCGSVRACFGALDATDPIELTGGQTGNM